MRIPFSSKIYSESEAGKAKRYKRKIRTLRKQKYIAMQSVKALRRKNARIRKDVADLVYEWCHHCGTEAAIRWDVKADGYIAHCPYCGEKLALCSMCDDGIQNCGLCGFGYSDDSCFHEGGTGNVDIAD